MEGRGRNNIVTATVPLAEMMNYAPSLKSMTAGKGSYSMQFLTYDPVPSSMQDKLVKDVNRLKSGEDD
jgi:elongation factor G